MDLSSEELDEIHELAETNEGILTYDVVRRHIISRNQDDFIDYEHSTNYITSLFNKLQSLRICSLFTNPNSKATYAKVRTKELVEILNKLNEAEYKVYCAVEQGGNVGIWTKDIKNLTGYQGGRVNKITTHLANEGLIKPVKNINCRNRKSFILVDVSPAVEVVGDYFYSNGDVNKTLVDSLQDHVSKYLKKYQGSTLGKITEYIKSVLGDKVTEEGVEKIIQILILENKAYAATSANNSIIYIWCGDNQLETLNYSHNIPCFSCPLLGQCENDLLYKINPVDCIYLKEWLDEIN